MHDLVKSVVESISSLPALGDSSKGKEESYEEVLEQEVLYDATLEGADELFRTLVTKDLTPDCIEAIFKVVFF